MTSGYLRLISIGHSRLRKVLTYNVPCRNHSILPALLGSEAASFSSFSTCI